MRVHRQTNRRRVSDDFWRSILRERVRNRLPIDAETIRRLGIACGRDRLTRLRGEVLRELETEFAAGHHTPQAPPEGGAELAAVAWGEGTAPVRIISEPWAPERAGSAGTAVTVLPTARATVVAVWGAMLRLLRGTARRLAEKGSVEPSRVVAAARSREGNR
jgi:hypothetical protein